MSLRTERPVKQTNKTERDAYILMTSVTVQELVVASETFNPLKTEKKCSKWFIYRIC